MGRGENIFGCRIAYFLDVDLASRVELAEIYISLRLVMARCLYLGVLIFKRVGVNS